MPYPKNGRWIAQVRKQGKRLNKVFQTRKAALTWEKEMRLKPVEEWNETLDTTYLGDWAQSYLDFIKVRCSIQVYKEKVSMFRRFFKAFNLTMPAEELKPAHILNYVTKQKEVRSGYAANKDRKNLVAGWNWGMKYMDPPLPGPNPCLVEKMPEVRHPRYIPPEEDFWAVYKVAEGQDRVLLLTLLHTAARCGEIFKLTWEDVDFQSNRIRLWTRKRKDGSLEYDWLPMTKELRKTLLWWWENRPIKDKPHVFLCLNEHPGQKSNYGRPYVHHLKLMHRLCERAGVKHFGFHAIRHLTSRILHQSGYSARDIQPILRHRNARTTEIYIGRLGLEKVRDTLETLPVSQKDAEVILFQRAFGTGDEKVS